MNLTLSIDDEMIARARKIAEIRGTSINQMVRDFIAEVAGANARLDALDALEALWRSERYASSGAPIRREDAYEERTK